jgi:hypothetical protein
MRIISSLFRTTIINCYFDCYQTHRTGSIIAVFRRCLGCIVARCTVTITVTIGTVVIEHIRFATFAHNLKIHTLMVIDLMFGKHFVDTPVQMDWNLLEVQCRISLIEILRRQPC